LRLQTKKDSLPGRLENVDFSGLSGRESCFCIQLPPGLPAFFIIAVLIIVQT
jgi:hypothetical protein